MWSVKGSKNILKQIQYVSNFQDSKFISTQLFTTITRFELFIDLLNTCLTFTSIVRQLF